MKTSLLCIKYIKVGDAFIISQLFVVPLSLDFALVRYPKTLWAREMAFAISFNDLEM